MTMPKPRQFDLDIREASIEFDFAKVKVVQETVAIVGLGIVAATGGYDTAGTADMRDYTIIIDGEESPGWTICSVNATMTGLTPLLQRHGDSDGSEPDDYIYDMEYIYVCEHFTPSSVEATRYEWRADPYIVTIRGVNTDWMPAASAQAYAWFVSQE